MRAYLVVGVSVAVLTGCAHPHAPPAPAPAPAACEGYTVDPTWLRRGPVYQPCDVDEPATAIVRAPTGYHPVDCANASVTVRLVVDTTGVPEPRTVTVVRTTASDFGKAAIAALRQWRFRPALKGGVKVRQVTQQRLDFACRQVPQR
jgi:TonB family protein